MPLNDRITLVEVVWTIIAVGGLGICAWALVDSLVDLGALRATNTDGAGRLVVHMNIRAAVAGTVLHAFFLLLGVAALLTLNTRQTLTTAVYGVGFILVALFNAAAIGANQLARLRLRRYGRAHPQHRRAEDASSAAGPPHERTGPAD